MTVRYRGASSSVHSLPFGCAQGDVVCILLFFVQMSDLGMTPVCYAGTQAGDTLAVPAPPQPALTNDEVRVKWVDDTTMAECIRLDKMLIKDSEVFIGPRNYHDRHGWKLQLDQSILQERLNQIKHYTKIHDMKVNFSKTKIIPFNFSKKYDFLPKISYDGNELEVEYKSKLLGVIIESTGRWNSHIEYVANKAKQRVFFLRRLKSLGATQQTLREIYILFIRSILEFSAPLWTGALTENKKLTDKLDRIQRYVCRVIRPDLEPSQAQSVLNLSSLEERRLKTSEKCANQMAKDPMFTSMFKKNSREASRNFGQYLEPKWNRKRYGCSSIPFFCRLLNKQQNQSQRMKR